MLRAFARPLSRLRRTALALLPVLVLAVSLPVLARGEDDPGQADLDGAIDAKLSANDLQDFQQVLDLCKRAIDKGLSEDSASFANDLYKSTLIDRASMIVDAIFNSPTPSPQWPQMRAFALRDLREAIDRDVNLGPAHLMIARLEALPGGDKDRAQQAANAAIERLADDTLQLAQAHVIRGNLEDDKDKQLADYDKAVELAPADKDVRRTRGLYYLLNDNYEKARADIDVAIEEDPDDASLLEALGMAYLMEEKLDEAMKAFDMAVELAPESSGALLQRARVQAMRENQDGAIADLDKAVELAPNSAIPLVLRARIHQQAGNTDKAQADLDNVLRQDPDNAPALELRGLIAADNADYPTAIRDFRRLVATNPEDSVVVSQLALLYLAAKQPREAIRRFTRAIELDDTNFLSVRGRSDAEISIGDHAAALADLERALELKPDDSGVLNNLAWLLATSPDDEIRDGARAIELAEKACEETEWQEAHIISTLAAGYAETGNFEKAREFSEKAVETSGEEGDIREQLEKELDSYREEKPWREKQEMEESVLEGDAGDSVEAIITDELMPEATPNNESYDPTSVSPTPRRPF
jgi:tetratricopeptide (TPR) repeat protein